MHFNQCVSDNFYVVLERCQVVVEGRDLLPVFDLQSLKHLPNVEEVLKAVLTKVFEYDTDVCEVLGELLL
jgi:hypothetical protein